MDTTDLQTKIREAYNTLATKSQDWVRLAALRPLVGGERADVDQALLALVRTGSVHVAPDSARMNHTDADREAAFRLAGEDNHFIAFDAD